MKRLLTILLACCVLLCGCSAADTQVVEENPTAQSEGYSYSANTMVRNRQVSTMLIGAVSYDLSGNSVVTSLTLLAQDEQGAISMMTIPKDTRVWVETYNADGTLAQCDYGPIGSVYYAAEAAGLADKKIVEAVSDLLGGIWIDHYVMLNTVQLTQLAALTNSIYVDVEDDIMAYDILSGYQDIRPRIVGYAAYSYLDASDGSVYPGTDKYKLVRHQLLIQATMQALAGQMSVMTPQEQQSYMEQVIACLRTDLTPDTLLQWLSEDALTFDDAILLPGLHSSSKTESYWIPNVQEKNAWVQEHFYTAKE